MRCLFYSVFITLLLITCSYVSNGQNNVPADSSAFYATKAYFENEIKQDAHLYIGEEYLNYPAILQGHPFFNNDQMQSSEIFYDGTIYKNVPLLYDIVRQEIVTYNYNRTERMKLINQKIKYFILGGHVFKNFSSIEGTDENVSSIIYDEAFDGKVSVLVKRFKRIKNGLKAEDPTSFVEQDEFYIRNEKSLYPITNTSSVVQALRDKKEIIKSFIRKNKFKFKKNIEKELIATATYYSTLN